MGLVENEQVYSDSITDINVHNSTKDMDKYSLISSQKLLKRIHLRKKEKERCFKETSDNIKNATQRLVTFIKNQEEELLNDLWKRNKRELSELQKCYSDLKGKLTDMVQMYQSIKQYDSDVSQKIDSTSKIQVQFQGKIEKEIESLSQKGRDVLKSTGHVITFEVAENLDYLNLGYIVEENVQDIDDSEQRPPTPLRQRSNTLISIPDKILGSGKSTLRKARSTNDIFAQGMTLAFQMSNEDLFFSSEEDLHSNMNPKLHYTINKHGKAIGEIQNPTDAVFLPSGNLLIAEQGNNRLQLFDIDTGAALKLLQSVSLKPCGISLTKDGYIAVADQTSNTIKALTRSGEMVCQFGTGYFKEISFIAAESNENYIVIDNMGAWQKYAFAYNCMTGVKTRIGYDRNGTYVVNHPEYIYLDNKNNLIISDGGNHCVWVFDHRRKLKFKFGQQGDKPGELCYPKGICMTNKGHFIVADCGNHRICQFDNKGNFVKHLLTKEHGLHYPQVVQLKDSYLAIVQSSGIIVCKL